MSDTFMVKDNNTKLTCVNFISYTEHTHSQAAILSQLGDYGKQMEQPVVDIKQSNITVKIVQ